MRTAMSCCTPPSAALTTFAEMPAPCASADMFWMKLPKSPQQRAASAGVERVRAVRIVARRRERRGSVTVKWSLAESASWNLGQVLTPPSLFFESNDEC